MRNSFIPVQNRLIVKLQIGSETIIANMLPPYYIELLVTILKKSLLKTLT